MDERDDERYDQDGPGLLDALATEQLMPKAPVRRRTTKAVARKASAPAKVTPSPETPEPLALYRRYRPDTFDALIGQEHVTEPLKRALTNNKVHHAYLFSGPRGCGKTSSARILARCLNCEKGPTATPCGVCQSCRDLATGGPGSIDVIEMDAATHGLVDDARDLRERAFFAPVQSRYKVYIIDEAHMVTPQGFNALLKIVEEPPPHVKFIFATTEPDKVIGTIRSRTHHYPFRLVPPKVMQTYLQHVCDEEGVAVEAGVLPLVVRAGAGSVRDSLSVLDQLLGGAGQSGVTYADTTALLGYTPDALMDEMVDALAAGDGAAVYRVIDKVIETGQDARHFGADLLQRLRDVLIVASVPDALTSGLIDVAGDQGERLQAQAKAMGRDRLAHAAEVMANGLTAMRGTTSPRLHLELMCSRILVPGQNVDALVERLSKVERQLSDARNVVPASQSGFRQSAGPAPARPDGRPRFDDDAAPAGPPPTQRPAQAPAASDHPGGSAATPPKEGNYPARFGLPEMKSAWPAVLQRVQQARRFTWILLSQNSEPIEVRDDMLTIGFTNPGARDSFLSGGSQQLLAQACADVTGRRLRINAVVVGPSVSPRPTAPAAADRPTPPPNAAAGDISAASDGGVSMDDETLDDDIDPAKLLSSALGAEVIAEEDEDV